MFNIKETPLPDYTRKEDILNSITHLAGVPVCIAALIAYLKLQAGRTTPMLLFSTYLFVISTLLVFAGSAIYHGLRPGTAKRIMRIADHCNIYIMISGSVTSLFLTQIYPERPKYAVTVITILWVLSAIGILLTFMDLKRFNIPQIFMYVGLGWISIFAMKSIYYVSPAGKSFVLYILLGGAFITVGTVLYLIGKKHRYFHAVFHLFVLAGTVCIFAGTYGYYQSIFI